jgi:hypothetical protein
MLDLSRTLRGARFAIRHPDAYGAGAFIDSAIKGIDGI